MKLISETSSFGDYHYGGKRERKAKLPWPERPWQFTARTSEPLSVMSWQTTQAYFVLTPQKAVEREWKRGRKKTSRKNQGSTTETALFKKKKKKQQNPATTKSKETVINCSRIRLSWRCFVGGENVFISAKLYSASRWEVSAETFL